MPVLCLGLHGSRRSFLERVTVASPSISSVEEAHFTYRLKQDAA